MLFKNLYIAIVIFVITMLAMPTNSAFGQERDKWVTTYNTMASESLYVHAGGYNSPYAIRIEVNGDQLNDTLIYGRKMPLMTFGTVVIGGAIFPSARLGATTWISGALAISAA
mgnify:CR=1 FL=1